MLVFASGGIKPNYKILKSVWVWWLTPSIPALQGQKLNDVCEFKAMLVYIMSSMTAETTWRNPVSKIKKGGSEELL